jgi:hypothetical protein
MSSDAGDVYGSGGDVDKEQYVLRDETPYRANFDGQEVRGRQTLPVRLQKRRPSGVCAWTPPVPGTIATACPA